MRQKYQITIKDNESGRILLDMDSGCIIGAAETKHKTIAINSVACTGMDLVRTILTLLRALDSVFKREPLAKALVEELRQQEMLDGSPGSMSLESYVDGAPEVKKDE